MYYLAQYLRDTKWQSWDVLQLRGPVWLIFHPGERNPSAVGKSYQLGQSSGSSLCEYQALEQLAPYAATLNIPQLLFHKATENGGQFLQTVVRGKPLQRELSLTHGSRMSTQFRKVEGWLATFQKMVPTTATLAEFLQSDIEAANRSKAPRELLAAATAALPRISAIPAVAVHGDFFGGNILDSGNHISVVDWDTFHYGSPLEDLLSLATGAVFRFGRLELSVRLFSELFLGCCSIAHSTRDAAYRFLQRSNLSETLLHPLFLMYLMRRLTRDRFADTPAWREFARAYAASGCPGPWTRGY